MTVPATTARCANLAIEFDWGVISAFNQLQASVCSSGRYTHGVSIMAKYARGNRSPSNPKYHDRPRGLAYPAALDDASAN